MRPAAWVRPTDALYGFERQRMLVGAFGVLSDLAPSHLAKSFGIGTMVWARVGVSDWWPGRVSSSSRDDDSGAPSKWVVTYYPPFSRVTPPIPRENIELYTESDDEHFKKRCSRRPHSRLFNETVATARKVYEQKTLHESCQQAAVEGDLDRLKQLIPELYNVSLLGGHTEEDYPSLTYIAAGNGDLESLKFLCEYGEYDPNMQHDAGGPRSFVSWISPKVGGSRGGPWLPDQGLCRLWGHAEWYYSLCGWAAEGGHLACLEYLAQKALKLDPALNVNRNAVTQYRFIGYQFVGLVDDAWVDLDSTYDACAASARRGSLECLMCARQNGLPWNQNCFNAAIISGDLACVKFCRDNNCLWDRETTYTYAVRWIEVGRTDIFECLAEMFRGGGIDTSKHYTADGVMITPTARDHAQSVQQLIDEDTQQLSDGLYMKLCAMNKRAFDS